MSLHQPFKPSSGGKVIPVGCSDKTSRANLQEATPGPKVTTYGRTTAAVEAYWAQRMAAGTMPTGDTVPGGEKQLAHKTREACWKDSVHLKQDVRSVLPEYEGIPADIEDKERIRTRGIPGYTGKQPPDGQSKPPAPAPNTSHYTAINAFDEPRPRVKGTVGYTGHQPQLSQQAAAVGVQQQQRPDMHPDLQQTGQSGRLAWAQPASNRQGPTQCTAHNNNITNSSSTTPGYSQHGKTGMAVHAAVQQPQSNRPGSSASENSGGYSPRFFLNGVEVLSGQAQLAPLASACTLNAAACDYAVQQQYGQQQRQQQVSTSPGYSAAQSVGSAPGDHPNHFTAWSSQSGSGTAGAISSGAASARPGSSPGAAAYHVQYRSQPASLQPLQGCPDPRRSRPTTYARAYGPGAGFGIHKYTDALQLASSLRPASAYLACRTT